MTFLEKGENIERENKSMRERGKKVRYTESMLL